MQRLDSIFANRQQGYEIDAFRSSAHPIVFAVSMTAGKPLELTFIYRSGCHLCDVMWEELEPFRSSPSLAIRQLDLARERGLESQYGSLIPVLLHADHEICHYFLDSEKLTSYLQTQTSFQEGKP